MKNCDEAVYKNKKCTIRKGVLYVKATTTVSVPAEATEKPMRMRIRINSNGLDFSEDEVNGFVYDFHIAAVEPLQSLTAKASSSSAARGTVALSSNADSYDYGTELTATATAANGVSNSELPFSSKTRVMYNPVFFGEKKLLPRLPLPAVWQSAITRDGKGSVSAF